MKQLLLISFGFMTQVAAAQSVGIWRSGSAKEFRNKVFTVVLFVSTEDDNWNIKEKDGLINQLHEAEIWLKNQAEHYSVSLKFASSILGYDQDIKLAALKRGTASGKEPVDWVSVVLKQAGYAGNVKFYNKTMAENNCDNLQLIIFVKGKGTSYSMAYSSKMNKELYFLEGSVLYEKYWNDEKIYTATIAHELLHLYGAWDLYKTFAQSDEAAEKAKKLWPQSIMRMVSYDINELNVDELTAWLVGWTDTAKNWYESFRPANKELH